MKTYRLIIFFRYYYYLTWFHSSNHFRIKILTVPVQDYKEISFSCGSFIVGHMIIFHALRTQKYKICSSENGSKLYKVHWLKPGEGRNYTPSIAFWHLPPSSARIGYATEGALLISAQLHVHRRCQRPPKGLGTIKTAEGAYSIQATM